MEHLLSAWYKVVIQFRDAKRILLFIDFDGTLTPIVEKPELVHLSETTKRSLQELTRQRRLLLGIISGRALADLKDKVGITGIIYAGNHGLEIEGPGISFVNPVAEELKPAIHIMYHVLSRALETIGGVFVEDKGLSLSIHYRLAGEGKDEEVGGIVKQVVGSVEATGKARITAGKKVYEVRPAVTWDKGKAIKLLMKKYGKGGRKSGLLPMYLGDDKTDEDGFKAIEEYGIGLSVFVGEEAQHSVARYFLRSPAEVTEFLGLLLEQVQKNSQLR